MSERLALQRTELEQAVTRALEVAASLGLDGAEVAVQKQQGLSVSTRLGEVETVEFTKDGALGIAVYRNGCKGNASTSDLSIEAIRAAVQAAATIANQTSADEFNGLADAKQMATDLRDLDLYHPHDIEPHQAIELAARAEAAAMAADSRIVNSDGATVSSHENLKVYGNSHGFLGSSCSSRHSLSCVAIGKDSQGMERNYDYSIARRFEQLDSPETVGTAAGQETAARLGARKLTTCQVPVLFDAAQSVGVIAHLVGAISGASLYRNASFLTDSLNQSLFPEWFNIYENPHLLGGLSSRMFDSEGVATQARDIIRDGVLQTYLLTAYSARRLGLANTGHAGGIYNWQLSRNGGDLTTMLKQLDRGLFVTELMGQGVNGVTGDYSRGAAGFWVENGQIQYPVHEITIASNLKQMYRNMVAMGSDVDVRHSLAAGPILFESMTVAGN
ncbi:MAG: metalloprotease PmbA [Ferrimonas sp.]